MPFWLALGALTPIAVATDSTLPLPSARPSQVASRTATPSPTRFPLVNSFLDGLPPVSIPTILTPALPNEGKYQTLVSVNGIPLISSTKIRFDAKYPNLFASVAFINSVHVKVQQHPGTIEPGGKANWSKATQLLSSPSSLEIGAFNSGFKMVDSKGGFYEDGQLVGTLVAGAASFIIYKDGHLAIEAWPKNGTIAPEIESIRQNITPLITNGVINKQVSVNVYYQWGATTSSTYNVWRSGIALDKNGNLIYVTGDKLTPSTLAQVLLDAGGVNAMELDINYDWTSFYYFNPSSDNKSLVVHKLTNFALPNSRYFKPSSRDFFALYASL